MKFFISLFFISLCGANAMDGYRAIYGTAYNGYVQGIDEKKLYYNVPAGYKTTLRYQTTVRSGNEETKLHYLPPGTISINGGGFRVLANNSSSDYYGSCT